MGSSSTHCCKNIANEEQADRHERVCGGGGREELFRAADKLGISKSLASREVSALERSLAVKLLNRSTRKLSLTEAGSIFYEHCVNILQEAELAERRATQAQSEPAGVVKMTAIPAFAVRHVLPAIVEFQQQYPKIQVRLSCSNRTVDLGAEGFDLGIRSSPPAPDLVARKLAASRLVLLASPAYLAQRGMPRRIEDVEKHDCVFFRSSQCSRPKGTGRSGAAGGNTR